MAELGRPTKYKEEYNELAYNYCLLGATDEELSVFFDVHISTIHQWKLDYPDFSDSIKKGKEIADAKVAQALYHRATGYSHDDVDIKVVDGQIVQTQLKKYYPPDATSAIFWLKNRQPKKWRDKIDHNVNTSLSIKDYSNMTIEEAAEEYRKLMD